MALGDHGTTPANHEFAPFGWVKEQIQMTVETYEYDEQGRVIKRTVTTTTTPASAR